MGDNSKYGAPVPVDVHMVRLAGFVDSAYHSFLTQKFGAKRMRNIQVDSRGAPTEAQYERTSQWLNDDVTPAFNEARVAGHDAWTPTQVQAALWAAFRKRLGLPVESPDLFLKRNSSTVPFEVAFGDGSPFAQVFPNLYELPYEVNASITDHVAEQAATKLAEEIGVRIVGKSLPLGAYGDYVNPSKTVEVLGTPSSVAEFQAALSYLLNQTDMLAYRIKARIPAAERSEIGYSKARSRVARPQKIRLEDEIQESPLYSGIDIILPDKLKDRTSFINFYSRLRSIDPSIQGASSVYVEGKPALRIIEVDEANPAWTVKRYREIEAAVDKVAQEFGVKPDDIATDWFGAELQRSHNDWNEDITGYGHLKRLDEAGRSAYVGELVDNFRPQVEQWIREGFERYAPDAWRAKQEELSGFEFGSVKEERIGRASNPINSSTESIEYKITEATNFTRYYNAPKYGLVESKLGTVVSPEDYFGSGWITKSGKVYALDEKTHAASLNRAVKGNLGSKEQIMEDSGLLRITKVSDKNGSQVYVEIFSDPTDYQIRSLRAMEKLSSNPVVWNIARFDSEVGFYKTVAHGQDGIVGLRRALDEYSTVRSSTSSVEQPRVEIRPSALGRPLKDARDLNRGWIMEDGTAVQVPSFGSHESSLAQALKIPEKVAFETYPALANGVGMIRVIVLKNPERVIAELFGNPSDAQLRSLRDLERAYQGNLEFAFTDPITQQARGFGEGVLNIRRKLHEIEAGEKANPSTKTENVSQRVYAGRGR